MNNVAASIDSRKSVIATIQQNSLVFRDQAFFVRALERFRLFSGGPDRAPIIPRLRIRTGDPEQASGPFAGTYLQSDFQSGRQTPVYWPIFVADPIRIARFPRVWGLLAEFAGCAELGCRCELFG